MTVVKLCVVCVLPVSITRLLCLCSMLFFSSLLSAGSSEDVSGRGSDLGSSGESAELLKPFSILVSFGTSIEDLQGRCPIGRPLWPMYLQTGVYRDILLLQPEQHICDKASLTITFDFSKKFTNRNFLQASVIISVPHTKHQVTHYQSRFLVDVFDSAMCYMSVSHLPTKITTHWWSTCKSVYTKNTNKINFPSQKTPRVCVDVFPYIVANLFLEKLPQNTDLWQQPFQKVCKILEGLMNLWAGLSWFIMKTIKWCDTEP